MSLTDKELLALARIIIGDAGGHSEWSTTNRLLAEGYIALTEQVAVAQAERELLKFMAETRTLPPTAAAVDSAGIPACPRCRRDAYQSGGLWWCKGDDCREPFREPTYWRQVNKPPATAAVDPQEVSNTGNPAHARDTSEVIPSHLKTSRGGLIE